MGAKIIMVKQARCADKWASAADALSKRDNKRVEKLMEGKLEKRKRRLPRELINWINQPIPDPELGIRVAKELGSKLQLLDWATPRMTRKMKVESNEILRAMGDKRKKNQKAGGRKKRR